MGLVNSTRFEEEGSSSPSPTTPPVNRTSQGKSMTAASSAPTTRVVTGEIRGSYCKLFKAELNKNAKEGDIPKFGMTLLIPKTDTVTLAKIAAAQAAAAAIKWPNKLPPKLVSTLHDGDEPRPSNGEDFGPECKGHMVMAVQSKYKPKVIDLDSNEIIDPTAVGSGDYFKVSLNFYGYDHTGKRGTAAGLNNVLFVRKGESLGGVTSAEDDFKEDLNQ